jgi:hypothetical protein
MSLDSNSFFIGFSQDHDFKMSKDISVDSFAANIVAVAVERFVKF